MSLVVPLSEVFADESGLLGRHATWERIALGEVCHVLNGFPFKSSLFNNANGFPVVRIRDIDRNATQTFYSGDVPAEVIVDNGDLLVGMDGGFRCCEWKGGRAGLNQRVCKLIPDERVLDRRFLLRGINGYLKAIENATSSVTVGHLSSRDVMKIPFPLPPLAEQRRIVAKSEALLGKVDACRARLDKIPVLLKRFRQSVLAAACSGRLTADWRKKNPDVRGVSELLEALRKRRVGEARTPAQQHNIMAIFSTEEEQSSDSLPDTWRFVFLNKLCSSFDYGTSSKSHPAGDIPVLRMGNIQGGAIDWSDLVYTSDPKEIRDYMLRPYTVLFNRTNSPELVGKTAIYRGERPAIFAGYLIRANALPELNPEYLNICLNTSDARAFCQQVKTDGVSQSNINAQKLGHFEVPLPPIAEQREIVRRVEALFSVADAIAARFQKAKSQVERLTPSLLAKAFRGELVPQDPNDEPASVLLERIRSKEKPCSQRNSR